MVADDDGRAAGSERISEVPGRFEQQVPEYKVIVRQAAAAVTKQLSGDFPWRPRDQMQGGS